MALIRPNPQKAHGKFLYYYFFSNQWRQTIAENTVVGATVDRIPIIKFPQFPISLPDLNTQQKIADTLSAYDDLIENNQKKIKLLEEAAQRLYKEWFIDLRFPGHENTPIHNGLPEGWEKKSAESFFEITIGKTPPRAEKQWFVDGKDGTPWVSISDMGDSGTYIFDTAEGLTEDAITKHNVKVIPKGTILVSFKLTVGRVSIATTNMCTNEAIAHFRMDETHRSYAYLYLKAFEYDKLGNTSSISKAVNSKIIKAMPFIMPDEKTLVAFSHIVSPLLNVIHSRQNQNKKLIETRDLLLLKLMNREIKA
jgi:type I restriction enzyme S subunit